MLHVSSSSILYYTHAVIYGPDIAFEIFEIANDFRLSNFDIPCISPE